MEPGGMAAGDPGEGVPDTQGYPLLEEESPRWLGGGGWSKEGLCTLGLVNPGRLKATGRPRSQPDSLASLSAALPASVVGGVKGHRTLPAFSISPFQLLEVLSLVSPLPPSQHLEDTNSSVRAARLCWGGGPRA
jgi:hypothetical protein